LYYPAGGGTINSPEGVVGGHLIGRKKWLLFAWKRDATDVRNRVLAWEVGM